jgi:hypothetical protein
MWFSSSQLGPGLNCPNSSALFTFPRKQLRTAVRRDSRSAHRTFLVPQFSSTLPPPTNATGLLRLS